MCNLNCPSYPSLNCAPTFYLSLPPPFLINILPSIPPLSILTYTLSRPSSYLLVS